MYTQYFGFREEPFADIADLRFFYSNSLSQKAYTTLLSGIRDCKGFLLLTGEAGTGKTTILRRVMKDLEASSHSLIFDSTSLTCTSIDDLLYFICSQLGMQGNGNGKAEKLQAFRAYLSSLAKQGGTGVLVVDEAHHLSEDVLNGLRMIAPLDANSERLLLQIVLVGPPELETKLQQPKLRPIQQRIALRCHVERFSDQNVAQYIHHRLAVVGYERPDLFSPEAVQLIASFSKGLPRLINIICDNALFLAHGQRQHIVSAMMVEEVVAKLRIVPSAVRAALSASDAPLSEPVHVMPRPPVVTASTTGTLRQAFRSFASMARLPFPVSWLQFGGSVAAFLVLLLGLFVYGRQRIVAAPGTSQVPALTSEAPSKAGETTTRRQAPLITNTEPKGQAVTLQAGQAQRFVVAVSTPQSGKLVDIQWFLDGQPTAKGLQWLFAPPASNREQRHIVTAAIADTQGRMSERQWIVTVARLISPPPRIITAQPAGQEMRVPEGQNVAFMVEVAQPQADVQYTWFLDGQMQAQGNTWSYEARSITGEQQTVTVQVRNSQNQVVERSWKIAVQTNGTQ